MLRAGVETGISTLDLLPRHLALIVISVISAVIMLLVFKAVTPGHWMTRPRDRMTAAVYEMRLYLDNPVRVLRAQFDMIRFSLMYSAAMLPAVIILTVPFGVALLHMEGHWGLSPLPTDEPIAVRIDLDEQHSIAEIKAEDGPDCARVTSPVMVFADSNVAYTRVELTKPESCLVTFDVNGAKLTKRLDASIDGPVSPARVRGLDLLVAVTAEQPVDVDGVRAISVTHAAAPQSWFGTTWPWWVHWLILVFAASGFLIKPLRITL